MVQESPGDSTRPPAEGRRLGGGAIASLSGVGLLLIFMIQNTERVRLEFLFWNFTWPLWLLTMASSPSRTATPSQGVSSRNLVASATQIRTALVVVAPLQPLPLMCSPDWAGGQPGPGRSNLIPHG
jgi:hypothetical protein